jgi:hypothetical protein
MKKQDKLVQNFLNTIGIVRKKYHQLAIEKGSYFNIFSILKIETKEVLTHSRFIAELLNPKGAHCFNDEFLKLFIEELKQELGLKISIDTKSCSVSVEEYQGEVTELSGGSIDILIKEHVSSQNVILIENKIYAKEQKNQLLRYRNSFPNGLLIFLTLYGNKSEEASSEDIDYKRLSYQKNIKSWLTKCKEKANSVPKVAETISQYLDLVNKLTNQNSNIEMDKELTDILLESKENYEAYQAILKASINLKPRIINQAILPILEVIKNDHNLNLQQNLLGGWARFTFSNFPMERLGIQICFSSSYEQGLRSMVFGFLPKDNELRNKEIELEIDSLFRESFDRYSKSGYTNWVSLSYFEPYLDWDDADTLKKIYFDKESFEYTLRSNIEKLLSIVNQVIRKTSYNNG